MSQKREMINDDANAIFTAEKDKPFNASVDISCDELRTQYAVSAYEREQSLCNSKTASKLVGYIQSSFLLNQDSKGHKVWL